MAAGLGAILLLGAISVPAAGPPPAAALELAQAPAAEAERIRESIQAIIEGLNAAEARDMTILLEGEVAVRAVGDGFHAVLPGVVLEGRDGGALAVGDVLLALTPHAADRYGIELALPETMSVLDEDGTETAQVTLGDQRFSGVWAPEILNFESLDLEYRDVLVAATDGAAAVEIGLLRGTSRASGVRPRLWTVQSSLVAENLHVIDPDGVERVSLARVTAQSKGQDMALADYAAFFPEVGEILAAADPEREDEAVFLAMLERLPRIAAALSVSTVAEQLRILDEWGSTLLFLEDVRYGLAARDLDQDLASVAFTYGHRGLASEAAHAAAEFLPWDLDLAVTVERLPVSALLDQIEAEIRRSGEAEAGDAEGPAEPAPEERVAQAMVAAATALGLSIAGQADVAGGNVEGEVRGDADAAFGAAGTITARLRGLDRLTERLGAESRDAAAAGALLQALGVRETDEGGTVSHRYELELTREGKILLNGNDIAPLLQAIDEL